MPDDLFGATVKSEFWAAVKRGEQLDCPCCGRYAQIYRRSLHSSVAMQLIRLYRLGRNGCRNYVHASHLILDKMTGMGDFTKAKYWGLIETPPVTPDQPSSGLWRLTASGEAFVRGEIAITRWAMIFADDVISFTGDKILITEALGIKFSYPDLMGFTPVPADYSQMRMSV